MHSIDQGEVTENEEHLEIIGEKLAFRFSMRQVLLLGNPDNLKPLLLPYKSEDSDRCPIGSICRIDYMKHALTSDYLVRSMTMDSEFSTPLDKDVLTCNQKRSFIFTINLPIDSQWLGFYYHYPLGVVADSKGLLGFLPYSEERVDDVVEVKVIVTLDSPCLFDIYDLTEETANLVRQCKPKKLVADGLLKSCDTGALISPKYPRLKLCLHPELKRRFEPGNILKTEFYPDEDGQRFISSNDEGLLSRISPEENVCLVTKENNEEYCLFLLAVSKVEVTEKLSKKTQKKKRIEQLEPPKFSDFEKHFCNFLYRPTGIISTTTNRRFK
uniref:CABIT domain-containing protein n=1 Tax=Panagrolaimus sp. JU765 TaxID=591449 RepID=A0AC34RAF4_9BILA